MVKEIFRVIKEINSQKPTVLLVEQNIKQSLALATRGYVLENGRIVLEDKSEDPLRNAHAKKAYLGM